MHIGFLTTEYPPLPSGGIGTSIRNLARALVAMGHRVTVIGWGAATEFEDQGVKARFLSDTHLPKTGWFINRLRVQRELRRLVAKENLQIVEAPDWGGLSAGLQPGCPVVVRCHGSAVYFAHLLHEKVRPSVRLAERMVLTQADGVVAVSRFAADITAQLFGLKKSLGVIPNGIDLSQFEPGPPEEIAPNTPNTLLYLGTLVRKKGVLDLCRAFSRVVEQFPEARLRLIGRDAADRQTGAPSVWALCREMLSLRARARVEYLGVRPYAEVQDYVRQAAVCVFPSHAEAMPLSWLEAMACVKPVVAYDIGWASEVVAHERTGLLVPLGDVEKLSAAIVRLLCDGALRNHFGAAGRRQVEAKFSAQAVAKQSVAWYRNVINEQNHG